MPLRPLGALLAVALCGALAGCGHILPIDVEPPAAPWAPQVVADVARPWGETMVVAAPLPPPMLEAERPYLLDSGDRLRIFVYAQPSLSRLYSVDAQGLVAVPLIGEVSARGKTTRSLARSIAARLGSQYVKEPHVTVDIAQYRPFFILGEVRSAGQYPYVAGMSVQAAIAVAGGYADRADERRVQITRRYSGLIEKMDVPPDYVVQPGDEIYVYERWL